MILTLLMFNKEKWRLQPILMYRYLLFPKLLH